jgi:hypothetical protein
MGRWTILKQLSKPGPPCLNAPSGKPLPGRRHAPKQAGSLCYYGTGNVALASCLYGALNRGEGGRVRRSRTDYSLHEEDVNISNAKPVRPPSRGEGGATLVELSVILFVLMSVGVLCLQTMMSGWMTQNWTIAQSMTDACAAIETANAQRWVFSEIVSSNRWPPYPQSVAVPFQIGSTPRGPVNVTVYRTCHSSQDPVTGLQTYTLESYVVYQDALRQYCKLSKVVRSE